MNSIYIIPTVENILTLSKLKNRMNELYEQQIDMHLRGNIKSDPDLFDLVEPLDIGNECEFRFYKKDWTAEFIGKVLNYGSHYYENNYLKNIFKKNLNPSYVIEITGGPDTLSDLNERVIYFRLIKVVSEIFNGMIFIDPEGNINNSNYYNNFDKRLYSIDDFIDKYDPPV